MPNRRLTSSIFFVIVLAAPMLYFFIGIPAPVIQKDAAEYNALAISLATGHGLTIDGSTFYDVREPGYPFFLSLIYSAFGSQNFTAVFIIQTLLLGLLGFMAYRILAESGVPRLGWVLGLAIALLPPYGLYAHKIGTELLFTFLIGVVFYLCVRLMRQARSAPWHSFAALGITCGAATLVREQCIFLLPLLILFAFLFRRYRSAAMVRNAAIALLVFLAVIGAWASVVRAHTGHLAITEGRPERALYIRAVHTELSYRDLVRYGLAWIKRSTSGGTVSDPFLDKYDSKHIDDAVYAPQATSTQAIAALKAWSLHTIFTRPGHYLFGNAIEAMKLLYIDHDYSDTINRYIRAGTYVIIYGLFLFGLVQLLLRKEHNFLKAIACLALFFIVYNILALTPFDTLPRYNTPFLFLFLVIGFAGIALYRKKAEREIL